MLPEAMVATQLFCICVWSSRTSFHVGYCNLHRTMAWIIGLKSESEKTVTSPDVPEMKDKLVLMTRAS